MSSSMYLSANSPSGGYGTPMASNPDEASTSIQIGFPVLQENTEDLDPSGFRRIEPESSSPRLCCCCKVASIAGATSAVALVVLGVFTLSFSKGAMLQPF